LPHFDMKTDILQKYSQDRIIYHNKYKNYVSFMLPQCYCLLLLIGSRNSNLLRNLKIHDNIDKTSPQDPILRKLKSNYDYVRVHVLLFSLRSSFNLPRKFEAVY
jgi:hypothetical protein